MENFICAAWGALVNSTTYAPTVGGTTCTTSLRAAKVTHTAPTDGATTFDSPFSAVLLAVWELGISLSPRFWSERGLFCVLSGLIAAVRRRSERRKARARPPCAHAGGLNPLHHSRLTTRRRGRRAPKGADGAHGAASGARTARGREADRRDSGDARARAPRATDRAAGAGHESAPPVPRYNFRSGANPAGVRPTGGRGERP